jgi:hypothetical protein
MVERFIEPRAFLGYHTVNNSNSRPPQNPESLAAMPRIRIGSANHNPFDSGCLKDLCAGRRPAARATRLQRHVKSCAFDLMPPLLRIAERLDFRMGFSRTVMPASPDDLAPFHQHRPDHRVGRSRPIAPPGQAQSPAHVVAVQVH